MEVKEKVLMIIMIVLLIIMVGMACYNVYTKQEDTSEKDNDIKNEMDFDKLEAVNIEA